MIVVCTMARQTAQKKVFWKGRYFFRDRDTSCGKGDTSSEIEILLVESEILFRDRDTSMEIEDTSLEIEMLLIGGILHVCIAFVAGSFCRVVVLLQFVLSQPLSHTQGGTQP